jgi:hypothetical protein
MPPEVATRPTKIHFVVPGFSKCGTTTLCAMLDAHPEIHVAPCKEPGYFAQNFHRGAEWYAGQFRPDARAHVLGEGSTFYASAEYAERAVERLLAHSPDVRLIFMVRDPIGRLESSFREMHHSGWRYGIDAPYDIGRALQQFPNMVADTRFWRLFNVFRRRVPDERIRLVFLDVFERDPAAELARCFAFLGVDPAFVLPQAVVRLNDKSTKLFDSPVLRFARRLPLVRSCWARLSENRRDRLICQLGLRRAFRGPVSWDSRVRRQAEVALLEDAAAILRYTGRPLETWPWVAAHIQERSGRAAA